MNKSAKSGRGLSRATSKHSPKNTSDRAKSRSKSSQILKHKSNRFSDSTSQNSAQNSAQNILQDGSQDSSQRTSQSGFCTPNAPALTHIFAVQSLSHEGRGVALYGESPAALHDILANTTEENQAHVTHAKSQPHPAAKRGKKVFIRHALPGEIVRVQVTHQAARFDEAQTLDVLVASPDRVSAVCPHVAYCGGCSLQHVQVAAQLSHKQAVLASHLQHFAGTSPQQWLPAIHNTQLAYRRRARVSVRYLLKQKKLLIGFRGVNSQQIQPISDCAVLEPALNHLLKQLPQLFATLQSPEVLGHVELIKGDRQVAMLIRHTAHLPEADVTKLRLWAQQQSCQLYLQGNDGALKFIQAGVHQVAELYDITSDAKHLIASETFATEATALLHYSLPQFDLHFAFLPTDFIQVNAAVNVEMVQLACDLLQLQTGQRVLDLFCGLGNFALAMARQVGNTGHVVGVEGSAEMVARAAFNAQQNGIAHAEFYAQDLTQNLRAAPWAQQQFDAILIDPPRVGAVDLLASVVQFAAAKIVYVSCDPATLARDAGLLQQHGYTLKQAGIMDMFSHTSHVESIALFEKLAKSTTMQSQRHA